MSLSIKPRPRSRRPPNVIERWSEAISAANMPEEILVDLGAVVSRHPWWEARAGLTLRLLQVLGLQPPARVLDAGCGWGITLEALEQRGYQATGLDVSRRALERLDRPGRMLVEADLSGPIEHGGMVYDAVLALDVIEHLDDDRAAVRRLGALVGPGGRLIVSVPALPALFTEFDAIQGHRRRYLPETLRAAFACSGLELERVFWWGRWLVPFVRRQRAGLGARPGESAPEVYRRYLQLPPWPLLWVARLAFWLEETAALQGRLRMGTSLFAVARRAAPDAAPARHT
jgi:2-polyprenyl-3-methyl-5-hydroxy-6-metoxy-1,4-benzoquinol methylase